MKPPFARPERPADSPIAGVAAGDKGFSVGANAFFDRHAEDRETWVRRNHYYYDDILALCEFVVPRDCSVLEIGCGTGNLIGRLQRPSRWGVDISPKQIAVAQKHFPDVTFQAADVEDTAKMTSTLREKRFGYILISDTLSYVHDVQAALENASRFLEPNGRIVLTNYNNLWEPVFNLGTRLGLRSPVQPANWLDDTDFKNLFELTGLDVVSQGSRLLFPKPIPLFSSFINRVLSRLWPFHYAACYHFYVLRPGRTPPRENVSVSIIVPARGEAGTIPLLVSQIPEMGARVELIFVEGHSRDGTWEAIEAVLKNPAPWLTVLALRQEGEGKADAVHKGFAHATGDLLMILDADLGVQPFELARFYHAAVDNKGDFINGSRLVYRIENDAMPFLNMIGNKLFGKIFSYLLGQPFKDTLCGTKALWRKDWPRIAAQRGYFGDFDPFGDFELLFGAAKLNLKIINLPIHYKARIYGQTNIRRFRHALILFRMCGIAARRLKFT